MDPEAPKQLPPSRGFLPEEERLGLQALFDRVFSGKAVPNEALQALRRRQTGAPRKGREEPLSGDAPRYVAIYRGESGIGKTWLFRSLRELARREGVSVYEIVHRDVEAEPLGPFARTIRKVLEEHDEGGILKEKYRYGLEALLPELYGASRRDGGEAEGGEPGSGLPEETGEGERNGYSADGSKKIAIFDAIAHLFIDLASRRPIVLLVHDLHWSDRSTIELLAAIGRNLALRGARTSPSGASLGGPEALPEAGGPGPELDGFETEEWRSLARKRPLAFDIASMLVSGAEEGRSGTERRLAESRPRLMVFAAYRGFPEGSRYFAEAVEELGAAPFAYHGELRPLELEETAELLRELADQMGVAGEVPPEFVAAVHEESEGYVSFARELVRAVRSREGPFAAGDAWPSAEAIRAALDPCRGPPPGTPAPSAPEGRGDELAEPDYDRFPLGRRHAILRLRLASSSPAETAVLRALAIAKRPLDAALLEEALGPGAGSAEALSKLESRGIVERFPEDSPAGAGGHFFAVWDYVLVAMESLDEEGRKALHQGIAQALERRLGADGGAAYELCYHLRRGPDPRAALPFGLAAARRFAGSFALAKARRIYASVLAFLSRPEDAKLRGEILEAMARLSLDLKEPAVAKDLLRKAQAESDPAIPVERRVDWVLLEAEAAGASDRARGLKVLSKTSKFLRTDGGRAGARVQLATARMHLARADLKRAINFALKGIAVCQKLGDVPEVGELYRVLASAFYRKGEYTYAVDNYQRALDAFERMGLRGSLVSALDELGRVYLERGNYFRAARYFYRSLEIRRRRQDVAGLCKSYDALGQVYLRSGDYLKTIENLNRSLSFKERIGDLAGLRPTLIVLGDLYFRLGRYEQAIFYFERAVSTSQLIGDTEGLVEAFQQLGRVYFEAGDIRRAEDFSKQVGILASEFKLRSQEADGLLLEGSIRAFGRDWNAAEKCFRTAAEVHGKLGHRRREVCALLNLADCKFERELYDEALKYASRAQIIADEVKALDLQVRALTLKGNVHRFLKGGNREKAREFLHKALDSSQGLSDVGPLFQLFYSLARVCHADREYAEASSCYGKAELVLKQIGESLSDALSAKFFEDRRRKVFLEDLHRFRQEFQGQASNALADLRAAAVSPAGPKERQATAADYRDLLARVLRLHAELNQLRFHERLLAEALELSGADRGFVLRVQNRQYYPVASQGFGKNPAGDPEFVSATALLQEAIRKGKPWSSGPNGGEGADQGDRPERRLQFGGLAHRAIVALPFMTDERIFGGLYLDKPVTLGPFGAARRSLLEAFASHAAVALANRRELETAIREPVTGCYTASYFTARLREAYRWFNLHGKTFTLVGFYLPTLEGALADGRTPLAATLSKELEETLPQGAALSWASPILYALLSDVEAPAAQALAEKTKARLSRALNEEVPVAVLPVHNRYQHGAEMYFEMRRRLLPEVSDAKAVAELRALLADGVSLREAKRILEKHKIETTLRKTGGNITHAARELGIHRPQLSNLLKKHSIKRNGLTGDAPGEPPAG